MRIAWQKLQKDACELREDLLDSGALMLAIVGIPWLLYEFFGALSILFR